MAVLVTPVVRRSAERVTVADDVQLDRQARRVLLDLLLRQASPASLEVAVGRVQRSFPSWHLPPGANVHERLARFLGDGS